MYILPEKIIYKSLIIAVSVYPSSSSSLSVMRREKEETTGEFTEAQRRLNIRKLLNYFANFGVSKDFPSKRRHDSSKAVKRVG